MNSAVPTKNYEVALARWLLDTFWLCPPESDVRYRRADADGELDDNVQLDMVGEQTADRLASQFAAFRSQTPGPWNRPSEVEEPTDELWDAIKALGWFWFELTGESPAGPYPDFGFGNRLGRQSAADFIYTALTAIGRDFCEMQFAHYLSIMFAEHES